MLVSRCQLSEAGFAGWPGFSGWGRRDTENRSGRPECLSRLKQDFQDVQDAAAGTSRKGLKRPECLSRLKQDFQDVQDVQDVQDAAAGTSRKGLKDLNVYRNRIRNTEKRSSGP